MDLEIVDKIWDIFATMDSGLQLKLFMFGLLIYMFYKFYEEVSLSIKSTHWPMIRAQVTSSSIDRNANVYEPKIIYRYQVGGIEYINDTYSYLGTVHITKRKAIDISRSIPEKSELNVYVDPADPNNSTIVPGIHWYQIVSLVLIFGFFVSIAFIGEILNFISPG